ncbi:class I SAM-dependent methyltransferase [Thermoactinomyces sp. DSM 45892]|uniref:class I SAM-dependent methyltransferase n=1 Tax=Thermoactinomyces sp. DSM 45892 TaxID=1882753 RepID=UPI00089D57BC|nr:SAM-dependent methyltransferase [Thermoactinomyces sp. DSM 45892]SDY61506.1 SAM-dependent methyltransferase, MidA family [Thermoactinomyces sp. DSM 45892]
MSTVECLKKEIVTLIREHPNQHISYQQFMNTSLYHPKWGYYSHNRIKLGKKGDFYTNAHVGDVYGTVLAKAFVSEVEKWKSSQVSKGSVWQLVEMGSGDGRLMEQMIRALAGFGVSSDEMEIYLVETSSMHRKIQQERLQSMSPYSIQWCEKVEEIQPGDYTILTSNELVDAFPIHLLEWDGTRWLEVYIREGDGRWLEELGDCSSEELSQAIQELPTPSKVGQRVEMNLYAKKWLQTLSTWMNTGVIFTIDYGVSMDELYVDFRYQGTIRGFCEHQIVSHLPDRVGEVDLTAHVNFDLLKQWGETYELETISHQLQSEFLLEQGILELMPSPSPDPFSSTEKARRAIQQLVHPQWMGEAFQVLVQTKCTL